ncbi:MAG: hypothetical protein ACUVXI_17930 [bacterium]
MDGVGGRTVRGVAEVADSAREEGLLPLGLADGVEVKIDISEGTPITYAVLRSPGDSFAWRLRRLQDADKGISFA